MNEHPPIIVTGSIAIDRLMHFKGRYSELIQPDMLDQLAVFPLIDSVTDALGGVGANIAYSLALLGNKPVLLGSAGYDADAYMQKLAADGIEISHVHRATDKLTASFTAITDEDQSQVGGFYPGAMSESDSVTLEPFKDQDPLILIGPHDPAAMKRQVQECKQWNLKLIYDVGQQVANLPVEDLIEGVETAHLLILNEYELSLLAKKTGRSVAEIKSQVPIVVTTLGKDGSRVGGREVPEAISVGIATPDQIVDPTGAGDSYRAGFLHGFARKWPLLDCARTGAVMGSFAIEQAGTQNHRPGLAQIHARYQQAFNEPFPNYERT